MPDHRAAIERGKLFRDAPNELPGAVTAGEKISHGSGPVLAVLLSVSESANASEPNDTAKA
jgi:hypothetical protein